MKGSSVGRTVYTKSGGGGKNGEKLDCKVTRKDIDFANDGIKLKVTNEQYRSFMETIRSDSIFLEKLSIIDYSLLLGIHNVTNKLSSISINNKKIYIH